MRIIGLMTFVCMLLLLAMVPACLQFARACGANPPATMTTVAVLMLMAGLGLKR